MSKKEMLGIEMRDVEVKAQGEERSISKRFALCCSSSFTMRAKRRARKFGAFFLRVCMGERKSERERKRESVCVCVCVRVCVCVCVCGLCCTSSFTTPVKRRASKFFAFCMRKCVGERERECVCVCVCACVCGTCILGISS